MVATLPADRTRRKKGAAAPLPVGVDEEMDVGAFEALRVLRTQIAREDRVPPYVVFHDATLRGLAQALPTDEAAFLAVRGAGPGRWQKYGARVLSALAPFAAPRVPPGGPPLGLDSAVMKDVGPAC